jgi:hypothetical protein
LWLLLGLDYPKNLAGPSPDLGRLNALGVIPGQRYPLSSWTLRPSSSSC